MLTYAGMQLFIPQGIANIAWSMAVLDCPDAAVVNWVERALTCEQHGVFKMDLSMLRQVRQHTSAYFCIRQHTSANVCIRLHTSAAYVCIRQHKEHGVFKMDLAMLRSVC